MIRRDFLKTASALFAGWTTNLFAARGEYLHPDFGKYLSHSLSREEHYQEYCTDDYALGQVGPYKRIISFPTATHLVVKYEKGALTWVAFNVSKDLQKRMERMGPHELLNGADAKFSITNGLDNGGDANVCHMDCVSVVSELPMSYARKVSFRLVIATLS